MSSNPIVTPSAQQLFGPNPWIPNDTITQPGQPPAPLSQYLFATDATAQALAKMITLTVNGQQVSIAVVDEPFSTNAAATVNNKVAMLEFSDGIRINAGIMAYAFAHGYDATFLAQQITNEIINDAKLIGVTITAPEVNVNIPIPPQPPAPPAPGIGAFWNSIPLGANPATLFNLVTNNSLAAMAFNGETNVEAEIMGPNDVATPGDSGQIWLATVQSYPSMFTQGGYKVIGTWQLQGV